MVLTMKLTSFAYNLCDGTADSEVVFADHDDKKKMKLYSDRRYASLTLNLFLSHSLTNALNLFLSRPVSLSIFLTSLFSIACKHSLSFTLSLSISLCQSHYKYFSLSTSIHIYLFLTLLLSHFSSTAESSPSESSLIPWSSSDMCSASHVYSLDRVSPLSI